MLERLRVGPIGENAYIMTDKAGCCILIDPGDEASRILSFLASHSLRPTHIVCTHGHLDHTGAISELMAVWESRGMMASLAVHGFDADYFGDKGEVTNRQLFAAIHALGYFDSYWRPLPSPELLLSDGDLIPSSTLRVIHTPGHTKGSICLHDEKAGILISGDTLFRDGVGRTDGPDSDSDALRRSLDRLFALPPETKVFPGHGEPTTIAREFHVI
jgi:hydroxyacylglutathione hydrolase